MKNKQLEKRKEVTKTRGKRQAETTGGERTVTVSGSLGPFSLLLQVSNRLNQINRKTSWVLKSEDAKRYVNAWMDSKTVVS